MNTINDQINTQLGVIADAVEEIEALCGTAEAQEDNSELRQFKAHIRVTKVYKDSSFTSGVGVAEVSRKKGLPSRITLNGSFSYKELLFIIKELLSGPMKGGAL